MQTITKKTLEQAQYLIKAEPNNPTGYNILVKYYIQDVLQGKTITDSSQLKLSEIKKIKEGLPYFKKLATISKTADMYCSYGMVTRTVNELQESEWALKNAIKLDPNNIIYHVHYGYVLHKQGKSKGLNQMIIAVGMIDRLNDKEIKKSEQNGMVTEYIGIYNIVCNCLLEKGNHITLSNILASAVKKFPNHVGQLLVNVGKAMMHIPSGIKESPNMQDHYEAAVQLRNNRQYEKAYENIMIAYNSDQKNMDYFIEYMTILKNSCRWREFQKHWHVIQKAVDTEDYDFLQRFKGGGAIYWGLGMKIMYESLTRYLKQSEVDKDYQFIPIGSTRNDRNNHTKLRIAYVSSNFRRHAQGYQLINYFKHHNKKEFELYGISLCAASPGKGMLIREIIKKQFDHWKDVEEMNTVEIAQYIYQNEIDIIIDLCGLADCPNIGVFAFRPAPVQISFLGYPGTTGANYMDFYISDKISTPTVMEPYFTEKLIYMPDTYQITEHAEEYELDHSLYDAPYEQIVFCNFNVPIKISHEIFTTWMNIMKAVPNSVLWLLPYGANEHIIKEAETQGVASNRIVFLPIIDKKEHMKRIQRCDLLLDTTNYNSHTTAGDALWTGIPVLTILGDTMPGRVCASILTSSGLPELITTSIKEYEVKAIELATNREKILELKKKIIDTKYSMPVFDMPKYVKNIEMVIKETWKQYITGDEYKSFDVIDL